MDEPMIECSGVLCPGNNWFHLPCLSLEADEVLEGEFYCSDDCRERHTYKYCCFKDLGENEPMIACDNPGCPKEWFHLKCKKMKSVPRGKWFCSKTCMLKGKEKDPPQKDDSKSKYIRALLYCGLMDLVRHDAVRENDGEAMMSHWRHDIVQFHNRHHPKYVLLGHRPLAGVAGWLPDRLRLDSIWNRTVNLSGGPGRNIEADLVNEFLNREFKESLKDAGGNITSETVYRHSQMVGALGRTLDHAFAKSADITEGTCGKKTKLNLADEFKLFIKILHPEQLFKNIPGREFSSFPAFQYATSAIQPKRLQSKLMQLSKRLDRIKRYCE